MNSSETLSLHQLRQSLKELGSCDLSIEVNPENLSAVLTFVSNGVGLSLTCKDIYLFNFLADAPVADGLVFVDYVSVDKNEGEWLVIVTGPVDIQVKCYSVISKLV